MSEDGKPLRHDAAGHVARFFAKVHARSQCPFCGQTSWLVTDVHGEAPAISYYPMVEGQPQQPGLLGREALAAIPVYALTCRNCGFLRLHNRTVVDDAARTGPLDDEK